MDNDGSEQQPEPALVIIADSSPLFRSALRQLLREETDLEVIAEAASGQEAVRLCCQLQPDLVLMGLLQRIAVWLNRNVRGMLTLAQEDFSVRSITQEVDGPITVQTAVMPDVSGVEATREIKRKSPSITVLVLTVLDSPHLLADALRAGASGYVLKSASAQHITEAIRGVLRGESPLNQAVAMQLLHKLLEEGKPASFEEHLLRTSLLEGELTQREAEVLRLVARGRTNHQIAQSLFLSVSTVKKHVQHLIKKLGVSDRTQLAVKATKLGLFNDQDNE